MKQVIITIIVFLISVTATADNLALFSLKSDHDVAITEIKTKYDAKRTVAGDKLIAIATKYRDIYLKKDRVDEAVYMSNIISRKHKENLGVEVPKEYADVKTKFESHIAEIDANEEAEIKKINEVYVKKCNNEIKFLIASNNADDMREVKAFRDALKAGEVKVVRSVTKDLYGQWVQDPTDSNRYQVVYIFEKKGADITWVRYIGTSDKDVVRDQGKVKLKDDNYVIWGNVVKRIDNNRIHIGNKPVEEGGILLTRMTEDVNLRYTLK